MVLSFNPADTLEVALKAAAETAGFETGAFVPEVRTADARNGDFQANGVLGYAKARNLNPRATAEKLVSSLPPSVLEAFDAQVAGPGFINFTIKPAALGAWLAAHDSAAHLRAGAATANKGKTFVVDYSSPNAAKQMHVGHLRSAVIGEAICRMLEFSGATVVRDNHIGDWGTQFGKLIWAYKRQLDSEALARDPLVEFERLYKAGNAAAESDVVVMDEARAELVKLQGGDAANLEIWRKIVAASLQAFQRTYDQLGIKFDHTLGESFYNDKVEKVCRELKDSGLAVESQGALVVFHPSHPRFKEQPFIVRKSDGAANYATSDLATILYRVEHFEADGIIYVVDSRQRDHFEQLFLTAREWFQRTGRTAPVLNHVDFGTVLGENGKPLKTRTGENVKLQELLTEADDRAYDLVTSKSPEFSEKERREIATIVGVGSVQYADLAQNRSTDYLFAWDKMISLDGNTAAYLLYAVARIHSIFRKSGDTVAGLGEAGTPRSATAATGSITPETPGEIALARKLVRFPDGIRLSLETLRPHFLCLYLYELAGQFSAFYNSDKVIVDDAGIRARRLALCARTLLVLETGLELLGLRTLKRM